MGYEACGDQIHFPFELKLSPNPISEMQPSSSNSDQDREYDDDDEIIMNMMTMAKMMMMMTRRRMVLTLLLMMLTRVQAMMNTLKFMITFHRRALP